MASNAEVNIEELQRRIEELEFRLHRDGAARETAEMLNRVGPMLVRELDLEKLIQSFTDIGAKLVDAEFGSFFHNMANEGQEPYVRYAVSGVSKEDFSGVPMLRTAAMFAQPFGESGVVRSDDITRDSRYRTEKPWPIKPDGNSPLRSYLAAPVISRSGEILGGLFFGHSEAGKFTAQHEAIVNGIASQAAIAMDNARLFEQGEWAQNELRRANQELRRANRDLETFAYSASHDLQEPLRNVALGAQLLELHANDKLDEEERAFLESIGNGVRRMETLLKDLLTYTQAIRYAGGPPPTISADAALSDVLGTLKPRIEESKAKVTVGDLPPIAMHETHLNQVLQNLIGNALKYRRQETPCVHISSTQQDGWTIISVSDNGIGIEPQYGDQIFGLFKRLHSRDEYPGSGIGLAICQRIVEQYGGRIWLEKSEPDAGSTFCFAIPDRRNAS